MAAIVALEQILLIALASRVAECNVWSHIFFTGYIDHLVSKCTVFLFEGQQPWVVHLVHGLVTHNGEQGLVVRADREIGVSQAEHLLLGNRKSLPFHQRVALLGVLEESGACHDELPVTGTTVCPDVSAVAVFLLDEESHALFTVISSQCRFTPSSKDLTPSTTLATM